MLNARRMLSIMYPGPANVLADRQPIVLMGLSESVDLDRDSEGFLFLSQGF